MTSPSPELPADPIHEPVPANGRPHWGWWAGLAVIVIGFASIAIDTVLHFEDSPIDGPFQLFNGLRRLADGQRIGGTFQVFHGPGIPYLHLLPFHLFGGDFLASELSRQLVSITAAIAVLLGFFRAWTGSWRTSIPISVVALCALIPLRVNALLFPINSMIGLRSTMPIVIGIHMLLRPWGRRAAVERAALFALALAFGIEQGMAAIAALVAVQAFLLVRRRNLREAIEAAAAVAGGIVFYIGIVFVMSPTGFRDVMRYNFRDVPADQFWYFGAPPNLFFYTWEQLVAFINHPVWLFLILAGLANGLVRVWRGATLPDAPMRIAELFLGVYAILSLGSMLGTYNAVYQQPAVRVGLFLALVALRRWWLARKAELPISDRLRRHAPGYATLGVIGYALAGFPLASISVLRTPLHLAYAHGIVGDRPMMDPEWEFMERVGTGVLTRERARLGRDPKLWSTYASLLEWKMGVFHPSFDYIIHALGRENRIAYARAFVDTKPDVVQSLTPRFSFYEEWLILHHWDFYRPLLRDYVLDARGSWSFFWTRAAEPFDERPRVVADGAIPPNVLAISFDGSGVPADSIGLFEVRIVYRVRNPWRKVPVIGATPRYLISISGAANSVPVSLAPYETVKVFPVVTVGPGQVRMLGEVASALGGASLAFDSIHVERLRLSPRNRQWAEEFILGPPKTTTAAGR